jgi:hypothetical protein
MATDEPTSITLDILKKIHAGMGDLHRKVDDLDARIERGFAEVDRRFVEVDRRFAEVDLRFVEVDKRLVELDHKLGAQGKRLTGLEGRMHELVQVTTLSISRQLDLAQRLDAIELRVDALEAR